MATLDGEQSEPRSTSDTPGRRAERNPNTFTQAAQTPFG